MQGMFSKLTSKQAQALPLLSCGVPAVQVARRVGVSEQAISGWQKDKNFVACLEQTRRASFERVNQDLQLVALGAIRVLADLLHSGKSESVRLKAAQYVCDRALFSASLSTAPPPARPYSEGELAYLMSVKQQFNLRAMTEEFFEMLEGDEAQIQECTETSTDT